LHAHSQLDALNNINLDYTYTAVSGFDNTQIPNTLYHQDRRIGSSELSFRFSLWLQPPNGQQLKPEYIISRMYAISFRSKSPKDQLTKFKVGLRVSPVLNVDNTSILDKLQVVNFQNCYYGLIFPIRLQA
jgi:hypothetical protein